MDNLQELQKNCMGCSCSAASQVLFCRQDILYQTQMSQSCMPRYWVTMVARGEVLRASIKIILLKDIQYLKDSAFIKIS